MMWDFQSQNSLAQEMFETGQESVKLMSKILATYLLGPQVANHAGQSGHVSLPDRYIRLGVQELRQWDDGGVFEIIVW